MRFKVGIAALAFLALAGCSSTLFNPQDPEPPQPTQPEPPRQLSGAEITTTMAGTTFYQQAGAGGDATAAQVRIFFAANGTTAGAVRNKNGNDKDTGTWRVNDQGQLCRKWKRWRGGREGCYTVIKQESRVRLDNVGGAAERLEGLLLAGNLVEADDASLAAAVVAAGGSVSAALPAPAAGDAQTPTPPAAHPALQQQAAAAQQTALTAQQVRTTLSGNTVYERSERPGNVYEAKILFAPDGTMIGRAWGDWGEQSDTGKWRVSDAGEWCRTWATQWDAGKEGCFKVFRSGDILQMVQTSGVGRNHQLTVLAGNQY
jgi:hypothetical protein